MAVTKTTKTASPLEASIDAGTRALARFDGAQKAFVNSLEAVSRQLSAELSNRLEIEADTQIGRMTHKADERVQEAIGKIDARENEALGAIAGADNILFQLRQFLGALEALFD